MLLRIHRESRPGERRVAIVPPEVGPLVAAGPRVVIAFPDPLGDPANIAAIASTGTAAYALELLPRTTLAQAMDVLSSQATAAGYEAVLLGARTPPRSFPI